MMSTTQLSKKNLNLLQMPIGEHKNIIWQNQMLIWILYPSTYLWINFLFKEFMDYF